MIDKTDDRKKGENSFNEHASLEEEGFVEGEDFIAENEVEEESIIPEEDFREAIAVCRKDPQLNRLFELAPPGAKLFIGLGFYSTHFADKVDPRQYSECQAEIEPALTPTDLKYLIRFERDPTTKRYLRELLAQRETEDVVAEKLPPEPSDAPLSLPKKKRRRKLPTADLQSENASDKLSGGIPIPFKIAAMAALLLGGAFVLYVATRPSIPRPAAQQTEEPPTVLSQEEETPSAAVAARPTAPRQAPRTERTYALVDADEEDARLHGTDMPAGIGTEEPRTLSETNAPAATVARDEKRASRKPRVVFTEGKKIVKRPGGQIEVPRVFSCAGAGIKPFWVYGAHPEADAAREKKARDEWQALVRQARQGEKDGQPAGPDANML